MTYDIVKNNGHFEVLIDGQLICTADTFVEAVEELEKIRAENGW